MSDTPRKPQPKKPAFTEVSVVPEGGGPLGHAYAVRLDARPLRTPGGQPFVLPTRALAEAIAAEWQAAAPAVPKRGSLPLTQMAGTALDRIARHRADIEAQLLAYAETELLCHRAEHPPELVSRQQAAWQPLLDWLAMRHDALLAPTMGVIARAQPPASLAALRAALAAFDEWRLAAVSVAASVSGSLVIALALADRRLDAAAAFEAAELDESFQIGRWGEDEEARRRRAGVRAELELVQRFLALLAA